MCKIPSSPCASKQDLSGLMPSGTTYVANCLDAKAMPMLQPAGRSSMVARLGAPYVLP
jgi:hypothetical protein